MKTHSDDRCMENTKIPDIVLNTVLEWFNHEREQGSLTAYLERISLGGPSMIPENVLVESLIAALKEEGRGKKKGYVKRQLSELKPLCLGLGKLLLNTNQMLLEKSRERFLELSLLAERLNLHFVSSQASRDMEIIKENEGTLPCPVEPSLKKLHEYLSHESIYFWNDKKSLEEIVRTDLVEKGHKKLPCPDEALSAREWVKQVQENGGTRKLEEITSLFSNERDFSRFLEGNDFSYGLADIPDIQFRKMLQKLEEEISLYISEGEIAEGKAMLIPDNHITFLKQIPVIDGEWIDFEIAVYLETLGILLENDISFCTSADIHPFAIPSLVHKSVEEGTQDSGTGDPGEHEMFSRTMLQAREELERYPWKSCIICGREHITLGGYLDLDKKHWKGSYEIREGCKINSWNKWIMDEEKENQAKKALIAGLQIRPVDPYGMIGQVFETSKEAIVLQTSLREQNLGLAEKWEIHKTLQSGQDRTREHYSSSYITDSVPVRERLAEIRSMAENMAIDFIGTRTAVNWLGQQYFSNGNILFPEIEKDIDLSIESMQRLIETYNARIASEIEDYFYLEDTSGTEKDIQTWKYLFPMGCYISLETIKEGVLARAKEIFSSLSAFLVL